MKPAKWVFKKDSFEENNLSCIASVLKNRGYDDEEDIKRFMACQIEDLHNPFLLPDMQKIVDRINQSIEKKERIVIYGDYDVDGITSTAIMILLLKKLNADVDYYIPSRFDEGYGLNSEALKKIKREGADLIITVDCGITAVSQAVIAKEIGIDLIITDHHNCQDDIPNAYAVCNPKLPQTEYPFDMLAGAGIAFKIAQALLSADDCLLQQLIALSAVGTIADIAPLVDENRIIAKYGLAYMKSVHLVGLEMLIARAGLSDKALNAGHIGFSIGPRLNAVGRLKSARQGVELLTTTDVKKAKKIADELNDLNTKRQETEASILKEALFKIKENPLHLKSGTIIIWGENWHHGVIGIVASRLSEIFYRPSIVLSLEGDNLKGSARSIHGYSIFNAIHSQRDLLEKFGGHDQAAGLSLSLSNLDIFIEGIQAYNQINLTEGILSRFIKVDRFLTSKDISHSTMLELDELKPFGMGNSKPVFAFENLKVEEVRRIGAKSDHLKLVLNTRSKLLDSLYFKFGDKATPNYQERVDIAFNLNLNIFNGVESIQLIHSDMRTYNPYHNAFNKHWYIVYINRLISHILLNQNKNTFLKTQTRAYNDVQHWLKENQNIVISSYEGLLELAYIAHDLDINLNETLERGNSHIAILPSEANQNALLFDLPIYSKYAMNIQFNRDTDHHHLMRAVSDVFFDRQRFALLYKKILVEKEVSLYQLLLDSKSILLDRIALAFFEEAKFIKVFGNMITLHDGQHEKFDFSTSKVYDKFERFKERLYQLAKYKETLSDI